MSLPTKKSSPPPFLYAASCPFFDCKPFGQNIGKNFNRIPPSSEKILISRTRKVSLIKQQFSCNHPIQASFIAVAIAVVSFFLTSGFIYRDFMLILISQWLLDLIFSMTKALNGQNSSKQNFQPSFPPFSAIWKTLLHLLLVFLFTPSLFHFKF